MNAAKLDRRIAILRATIEQDPGSGENIEVWSELATVAASWRRASAREQLAASEISASVTDVFDCRWSPLTASITPKDRIGYGGRLYNIEEATELNRREGIRIRGAARADT